MENYDWEVVIPALIFGIIFLILSVINIRKQGFFKWFIPLLITIAMIIGGGYLSYQIKCADNPTDAGKGICWIAVSAYFMFATPIVLVILQAVQFFIGKKN